MQNVLQRMGWLCLALSLCWSACAPDPRTETEILVFSKTGKFRHKSIPAGQEMLRIMGKEQGWEMTFSEDSTDFNEENLTHFSTVILLNTTGDILNPSQQAAFERYIQAGGGFVGIHAASDTEYGWPWYNKLVGAYFAGHPPGLHVGDFQIMDNTHPSTAFWGEKKIWKHKDEFYNFKSFYQDEADGIKPLIMLDETSYEGGKNGDFHPMSWYHDFDGGRAFYCGLGHADEVYKDPDFQQHVLGGINYAIGSNMELNYHKARSILAPEASRFVMEELVTPLDEPMELEIMQDGKIIFTERDGRIKLYYPETGETKVIAQIDVYTKKEDGLTGIALDPNFESNPYLYLYYAPNTDQSQFQLSRFKMLGDSLLMASEKVMLEVPVQRQECCHTGGSIQFDPQGNLYLSTGDDTNPFETSYAPINEVANRGPWDAQKSSANPNDLRGKILRIKPTTDGGYTIPEGNLFPADGSGGRPEIYVMGCRNPYRIAIDPKTGFLYWGDVGPDGQVDSTRGPKGYDEVNQARKPGFFGWPYFIADNKPYRDFNFATGELGEWFDPESPVNNSPNNTGVQQLPPAQKAFIYYPYSKSKEFPAVGKGGRNAMAGPVFYQDQFASGTETFPAYYEGKLFIYDFMRDWVFTVSMNEKGDFISMEPF
ncbi:MAG: ThuA domain-containing protein, partial [Bacteroidota bacterium]